MIGWLVEQEAPRGLVARQDNGQRGAHAFTAAQGFDRSKHVAFAKMKSRERFANRRIGPAYVVGPKCIDQGMAVAQQRDLLVEIRHARDRNATIEVSVQWRAMSGQQVQQRGFSSAIGADKRNALRAHDIE